MTLEPLAADRARDLVRRLPGHRVLVVGDVMLDRFIVGTVTRISPEAPVPVVRFRHEYGRLGGAANVAANLAALGGQVSLVGVVGKDEAGRRLRGRLAETGISAVGLVEDPERPTVEKVRVVTERNQQVARIDYEHDADVSGAVEQELVERLSSLSREAAVVLVSDYLKGTVTKAVMAALTRPGAAVPLLVDPKIPHLDRYRGATLVTPNALETEIATHRRLVTDEDARAAAVELRTRIGCRAALITRGEQGMWLSSPDGDGGIPATAREVSDVTGAGDTVVATLALALAAGASFSEAAILANQAAGIVVAKFGPATVSEDELLAQFTSYK